MHLQLGYFSCIFSHTDILLLIITVESKNYFANFHIISPNITEMYYIFALAFWRNFWRHFFVCHIFSSRFP